MNTIDQEELRKRFNPDGSLLRKQQLRMLDMLKYIDGVCKKHGIKYWLSSGTLLGAVRHGGFIPWDDDLDIEMLKEDYDTLKRVLKEEKSKDYVWQDHTTDYNYVFPHAKLRDKHSFLKESQPYGKHFKENGIYIDIFKMEPSSSLLLAKFSVYLRCFFVLIWDRILKYKPVRRCYFPCANFLLYDIIYPCLSFFSKIGAKGQLRHTHGSFFWKPRNVADIFPLKNMNFEEIPFPVPHDSDIYLSKIYGDYMKIPELDAIQTHVGEMYFYDEKNSE